MTRRTRTLSSLALTLGFLLAVTACGSDKVTQSKGGDSAQVAENKDAGPSNDDAQAFLDNIFAADLDRAQQAVTMTVKGSLAYAYAYHQQQRLQGAADGGEDLGEPELMAPSDGGFKHCSKPDEGGDEVCTTYTDFVAEGDKFTDFRVNGNSLRDRLSIGSGKRIAAAALGSVEFTTAYKTQAGDLVVTLTARSAQRKVSMYLNEATYRDPSGRQSKPTATSQLTDLEPDSLVTAVLIYKNAKPGGRVALKFVTDDYNTDATATFETR